MFGIGSLATYQPIIQIGEGAYGCVYKALDKRNSNIVALKRLLFHKPGAGFPLCAVREIKLLKRLTHKNIVKLRDIVTSKGCEHLDVDVKSQLKSAEKANKEEEAAKEDFVSLHCGNLYLVFEYIEHDLAGLIEAKHKFTPIVIKTVMKQIYEVLDYLCSIKIVHRDIKSSNILISNRYHVKLADFGLARSFESADGTEERVILTNNVVTIWYRSPELLLGSVRYTNAVDTWSAACVHAELEMGRPIFPGKNDPEQLELICRAFGTPTEESWPNIVDLPNYESMIVNIANKFPISSDSFRAQYEGKLSEALMSLLERLFVLDPSRRTSARIALKHTYFLTSPLPPNDPSELGLTISDDSVSMHEYETKLKRRRKADAVSSDNSQEHVSKHSTSSAAAEQAPSGSTRNIGKPQAPLFRPPPPPPPIASLAPPAPYAAPLTIPQLPLTSTPYVPPPHYGVSHVVPPYMPQFAPPPHVSAPVPSFQSSWKRPSSNVGPYPIPPRFPYRESHT